MRNYFLILLTIIPFIFLSSCDRKKVTVNGDPILDTVWNDKVQDTFYGVKLGEPKNKIINALEANGFTFLKEVSTKSLLHFEKEDEYFFTFGGFNWQCLNIGITNNKFTAIKFYYPHKELSSSMNDYNELVNTLSKKYGITDDDNYDSTIYGLKRIFGRNNVRCTIACNEYESLSNKRWYSAWLIYLVIP